ncbi:DUF4199 domain-containing protein [Aestuariibaculum sediminum]|uniref:DUF4199 domain-containing protein n=1 Tax=Aestuariibaculum sediminum TaxID=2770637 RepID=A0A8J6Q838_9FLAO|nr:DUF4199 domain-containing protein [Aestuariibaculum sediminum]MBD0832310.1 DUF4199 domain-containing protein [Aestuariibaculum sediminum]
MEKTLKSIATNWGLLLGLLFTLLIVGIYSINIELFVSKIFGLSLYFIAIGFGMLAIAKAKQVSNNILSFRDSFSCYFLTIFIGFSIYSLISYILFNIVDTDAAELLKKKSMELIAETYSKMQMSQEEINKSLNLIESENLYSIKNSLTSLAIKYLVPLSIIGLIVAAAMKKSKPSTE